MSPGLLFRFPPLVLITAMLAREGPGLLHGLQSRPWCLEQGDAIEVRSVRCLGTPTSPGLHLGSPGQAERPAVPLSRGGSGC